MEVYNRAIYGIIVFDRLPNFCVQKREKRANEQDQQKKHQKQQVDDCGIKIYPNQGNGKAHDERQD